VPDTPESQSLRPPSVIHHSQPVAKATAYTFFVTPIDTRVDYPSAAIELLELGYYRQLRDVTQESRMRRIALAMLVATGYGLVGASGASAAPANSRRTPFGCLRCLISWC
jgi:hypothetical protein